ncbi:MAG: phospholipid carrier-dependent glycosyltransferase, partial [Brevibacterium yomogidense]
ERTVFTFYTIVMVPFTVLALTYALGLLWGRGSRRDTTAAEAPMALRTRRLTVGLVLALAVLACAFFWPVWTGTYIPREAWELRMWNPTWV